MAKDVMMQLRELNLEDKFLCDETMEDVGAYGAMVGILTDDEVTLSEKPQTEKELRVSDALRQVRLDMVGRDREGKVYFSEMQKNTGNLKKRSRFYQAQLDVSLLKPGVVDFNELNDSCFIMVSPFDLFGKGLYRYTFEGTCRECPELSIGDGAKRIFINTRGKNREDHTEEFLDFMEYIEHTTDEVAERTKSERIKRIHERVRQVRLSEKMGVKFMQRWEELVYARMEGAEEGEAIGEARGRAEGEARGEMLKLITMICKKLAKNKSPEETAEDLEEDIATIRPLYEICRESAPDYDPEKILQRYKGEEEEQN